MLFICQHISSKKIYQFLTIEYAKYRVSISLSNLIFFSPKSIVVVLIHILVARIDRFSGKKFIDR
jgi:hypothetical protein